MAGLNSILELGKRSLSTNQYGINVTSHNIANAATPGYSRQRLNVVPSAPEKLQFGYIGMGVTIESVQRLRERYIDQQMYTVNQNMGRASQQENIKRLTESFLQEPSDSGLSAMMTEFFSSFQELSLHPEESANRNAVAQRAALMTGTFHRIAGSIDSLRKDVLKEAESKVAKINTMISTIAGLDRTIMTASASGSVPNDVKDQRDQLLSEMSKLIDMKVTEDANGSVSVSLAGSMVLSAGNFSSLSSSMNGSQVEIHSQNIPQPLSLGGGELGALVTLHNATLNGYIGRLDQLASSLIDNVNALHTAGYGIGNPPPTGNNFFTGTDARSIALDPAVESNVNNIAASLDGAPGNNDVAVRIANLQNGTVMNGGTTTFAEFYSGFVSTIGAEIQSANTETESTQLVMEQLQAQQNSVSGVSLDEEMTNLIKYQHGFDAAARVVTTVNEMFQTIINM